ncbi:hypothetical protein H4Q26_003741 [Puccinia striiformis f. sp. tritici PST-130]|nr:hypothetical protein H4Q26_003741 [Puccinia striiformis f. sp. tritici PST-130]
MLCYNPDLLSYLNQKNAKLDSKEKSIQLAKSGARLAYIRFLTRVLNHTVITDISSIKESHIVCPSEVNQRIAPVLERGSRMERTAAGRMLAAVFSSSLELLKPVLQQIASLANNGSVKSKAESNPMTLLVIGSPPSYCDKCVGEAHICSWLDVVSRPKNRLINLCFAGSISPILEHIHAHRSQVAKPSLNHDRRDAKAKDGTVPAILIAQGSEILTELFFRSTPKELKKGAEIFHRLLNSGRENSSDPNQEPIQISQYVDDSIGRRDLPPIDRKSR